MAEWDRALGTRRRISKAYTEAEWFWTKVHKTEGCWFWLGSRRRGHGMFTAAGRAIGAHRYSYQLAFGEIPDGLLVCHHCDNRHCVRPDHLFLGTPGDNSRDAAAKGRMRNQRSDETPARRELARHLRCRGLTYQRIADRLGISIAPTWRLVNEGNTARKRRS